MCQNHHQIKFPRIHIHSTRISQSIHLPLFTQQAFLFIFATSSTVLFYFLISALFFKNLFDSGLCFKTWICLYLLIKSFTTTVPVFAT